MGANNANFPTSVRCTEEAVIYLGAMVQALKTNTYIAKTGAGPFTPTGTEMVGGTIEFSGSTTAVAVTTDTAANIQAAMTAIDANAGVGSTANMTIMNDNTSSGAITITAGANVTMVGVATVAIGVYRKYSIKWTAATTVSVTLIG